MIETDSQRRPWEGKQNQKSPSKNIGRGSLMTNANPASGKLPVYFRLMGNASNTDAGPLVPLDAGSHMFYILWLSICISMISRFSFRLLAIPASENVQGTSGTRTSVKSKKITFW